jgi:hypothetical protein
LTILLDKNLSFNFENIISYTPLFEKLNKIHSSQIPYKLKELIEPDPFSGIGELVPITNSSFKPAEIILPQLHKDAFGLDDIPISKVYKEGE